MNIEKFRKDFQLKVKAAGRSINSLAGEYQLEQASLSRFYNNKTSLSGEAVLSLMSFVYGLDISDKDKHEQA